MDVGHMLTDFIRMLSTHQLHCPSDLALLIRAMVTLEGVGRSIDADFDLATELAPFVESQIRRRYDPKRMAASFFNDARRIVKAVHNLPMRVDATLDKLTSDELKLQFEHRGLDRMITEFDRSSNRVVVGIVTSALIVASSVIIHSGATSPWVTIPIFVLPGLLAVWLVAGILGSGRL